MQKPRAIALLLALCWLSFQAASLGAQEWDEDEWDFYRVDTYARGDQTFTITLGLIFPTLFWHHGYGIRPHNFSPAVGGTGSLAYTYFFGPHFFVGAEIGVSFNYTVAENTIFIIPIGLRAGWKFVLGSFEFPFTLAGGIAPQRYMDFSYLGWFLRGGASAFFRFNPEWSFGVNTDWTWYPQRPRTGDGPSRNVDGNMLGVTFSARYHF